MRTISVISGTNAALERIYLKSPMRRLISRTTAVHAGLLLAVWTFYGLLSAWQAHYWYSFTKTPMGWNEAIRYEVTYAWLWAAFTPLILWVARRHRIERHHWPRRLLIHVLVMSAIIAITKTVYDAIAMPPTSAFHSFTWERLFRSIEYTFDTGTLLYWMIVLVEHAIVYYQRYQQGLTCASQLQTQLVQAQLHALKMQLHPHFLFNTLHTIAALVQEDPELAERTIARLSELLRLFLANSSVHEVPLSEELRILELYLEIERTRFEERFAVHYDVPENLSEAMVPNLVLQPLVENAIRHGVGRNAGPGWITVSAERYNGTLVLRVTDNGAGLAEASPVPAHSESTGMGLAITRGRLESLYGERQSLVLKGLQTGGAEVRITMPYRLHAEAGSQGQGTTDEQGEGRGNDEALQSSDR